MSVLNDADYKQDPAIFMKFVLEKLARSPEWSWNDKKFRPIWNSLGDPIKSTHWLPAVKAGSQFWDKEDLSMLGIVNMWLAIGATWSNEGSVNWNIEFKNNV